MGIKKSLNNSLRWLNICEVIDNKTKKSFYKTDDGTIFNDFSEAEKYVILRDYGNTIEKKDFMIWDKNGKRIDIISKDENGNHIEVFPERIGDANYMFVNSEKATILCDLLLHLNGRKAFFKSKSKYDLDYILNFSSKKFVLVQENDMLNAELYELSEYLNKERKETRQMEKVFSECKKKSKPEIDISFEEYQKAALRTDNNSGCLSEQLLNGVMGLNGEAGECIDIVKKWYFQGHDLDRMHLIEELGDVAWYMAAIANALDVPLSYIFGKNIDKLKKRYPNGFDPEKSINRKD